MKSPAAEVVAIACNYQQQVVASSSSMCSLANAGTPVPGCNSVAGAAGLATAKSPVRRCVEWWIISVLERESLELLKGQSSKMECVGLLGCDTL